MQLPQKWGAFRYAVNLRFLGDLFRALRTAAPPLWMASRSSYPFDSSGWYAPWQRPDAPPRRLDFGVSEAQEAHAQNGTAARPVRLLRAAYLGEREPAYDDAEKRLSPARRFVLHLKDRTDNKPGWTGLVLDLSRVSLNDGLSLLDGLEMTGQTAPPPAANRAK